MKPINENAKLLDLGSGLGMESVELSKRGLRVTGIDINEKLTKKSIALAKEKNVDVNFYPDDMENLNFTEEFDV